MALPTSGALTLDNIQTEFGGTNPIGLNEYYAGGGLVPAGTSGTYGAVPSSGALSVQNFYGTTAFTPIYIEDVFSTYLYTGNGTTLSINNSIDLAGKGGMVWLKSRSNVTNNAIFDTARGAGYRIISDTTDAQNYSLNYVSSFDSTGFSLGAPSVSTNYSNYTYASWTFRKQPKFFDVVTWTGNGANYRAISHSLGSTPGCVIVKSTSASGAWAVWHQSVDPKNLILNSTSAAITGQFSIQDVGATSFAVANSSFYGFPQSIPVNDNGQTYVAYLFAHNAGGFGLTGTDNVISCGSFTTDGSGTASVTLGYEAQWVMIKKTSSTGSWWMLDTMRGYNVSGSDQLLAANLSGAEQVADEGYPTATGFNVVGEAASATYIYIAIRRGPMKVPTSGTSVFEALSYQGTGASSVIATTNVADLFTAFRRNDTANAFAWATRLIGANAFLTTQSTSAQNTQANTFTNIGGKTITVGSQGEVNQLDWNYIGYYIGRAPSFMDVVCYTGTGVTRTVTHNLTVAPELMIVKKRNLTANWQVYQANLGATKLLELNLTSASVTTSTRWANTEPTSSVFTVGSNTTVNNSGDTYVAYLFATCAGVSKVGSYTGTAATQTINCGFTTGARFILIKRTDSTGDWYIWDSMRGITATNDPYFLANSYSAEVTNTNYVDAYSTGFQVRSVASTTVNVNGASYIFLAIA